MSNAMDHEKTIRTALEVAIKADRSLGWIEACKRGLVALTVMQEERESRAWLIRFEDPEMRPEIFTGIGAEVAARARFAALNDNWTVALFRSVDAAIGEPAAEQEREQMSKRDGVFNKFRVERTDGKSAPGEKHHDCEYFVLDTIHDPHSRPALLAYADSCEAKYPQLAADARRMAANKEENDVR